MMTNLTTLDIFTMLDGLRSGAFSCRELMTAHLERIQELDPQLHVFITFAPEQALEAADAADMRYAEFRKNNELPLPALLGLPIAVKDLIAPPTGDAKVP